jgi:type IV secretion system protein VirD4
MFKRPAKQFAPPSADSLLLGWESAGARGIGFSSSAPLDQGRSPIWYDGPHLLTVAPSGAGKCVSCAVPALLTYPGQAIVLDIKGELYQTTSRRRREMGHRIVKLDPFRMIDDQTDGLNSLDILSLPNADLETDCQTLAKLLSSGKGFAKDPFWEISGNGLNSGVLAYIGACEPVEKRNLCRFCELIYNDDVAYGLAVLLDTKGKQIPRMAYQEIAAFLQLSERETRPSTLATAQSFVKGLNSQRVLDALASSTVSLDALRRGEPISVYMILPPDRLVSHAAIISLWVGTLLKTIFSRTSAPALRTLLLLDEAASLGVFPMLETAITLCRTYGVRVWTFWQDLQQIQASFPTGWRTILNNSAIQSFGVTKSLMAQELAAIMDFGAGDLLSLARDEQLLQLADSKPFRSRKLNYLSDAEFSGLFDANRFYVAESGAGLQVQPDSIDTATGNSAHERHDDAGPIVGRN